jgi:hypothetical protein
MSTTSDQYARGRQSGSLDTRWATGFALAAASIMIMAGVFQALEGLAAVIKGDFFVRAGAYPYDIDVTTWGWIHLVVGIVLVAAGASIVTGAVWARATGILVACLSAVANFLFIPYYPFWSILIIALDVVVIWALGVANLDS